MTDKEYIRRYTDAAKRAMEGSRSLPKGLIGNPSAERYMDEFIQRFRRLAKGLAKRNVGRMPFGSARARAMRRSIDKVRDGAGVLHNQPNAHGMRLHYDGPLAKVT